MLRRELVNNQPITFHGIPIVYDDRLGGSDEGVVYLLDPSLGKPGDKFDFWKAVRETDAKT